VSTLQTFAALFLATCLATGWATRQKDPERIKVLLPLDAVFPSLALLAVVISWSVIVAESPSWLVTGVWVGLYSFVAAGSTILYFVLTRRSRQSRESEPIDPESFMIGSRALLLR
jgi:membrane protein implicated in regulation of membrane protease activity